MVTKVAVKFVYRNRVKPTDVGTYDDSEFLKKRIDEWTDKVLDPDDELVGFYMYNEDK